MEYIYKVVVTRVIDGDTVDVEIDLGFDLKLNKRVRLHGINTPEIRTRDKKEKARGYAAKERLQEILKANDNIVYLQSVDKGKYGRCVGILFEQDFLDESINDRLLSEGHAVKYK